MQKIFPINKTITDLLSEHLHKTPGGWWYAAFSMAFTLMLTGAYALFYTVYYGLGTWGLNRYVGWGMGITNFVWWVGIGHAGTFISAVLLLFRQKWRTAINRAAEAMTIFAIICAAIFPIIHMGRPWFVFYTLPYPNLRNLSVNFNSPLVWDVFAISTYFLVSLVFWYMGLIPDLALLKYRAIGRFRKKLYALLSINWTFSGAQWQHYEKMMFYMAALATPLVFSVHTIVSLDFASAIIPGWHSTIFPPYFVIGAIFSGFAMVQTLLIITRKTIQLEAFITDSHIEKMNRIILVTGSMVAMAYFIEIYSAYYTGDPYEQHIFANRLNGTYKWQYLAMLACNVLIPQLLWFKKIRWNMALTFILSIFINVGMWMERYVIVVSSLSYGYLPSTQAVYQPSWVELLLFLGSMGTFLTFYLLFCRLFPVISIHEIKTL